MKKLLINSMLGILLNSITSAAPANCIGLIKASALTNAYVSAYYEIHEKKATEFEIHPLDILALRFN